MTDNEDENKEVIEIAVLVAEAANSEIPGLLLRLKDLLERYPNESREQRILRRSIWKYDLLSWCAIALKYDYSKIRGGLEVAVSIAGILCGCCCNLDITESQEFSHSTLPSAIQSYMRILRQFQQRINDNLKKPPLQSKTDAELTEELFHILTMLITSHPYLCPTLLNSNDLLRLAMDEERIFLQTISLVQRCVRVNRNAVSQITQGNLQAFLDEVIFKLTASEDKEIARASARLITTMSDAHNQLVPFIVTRYKGLKVILGKWNGHGFDRELSHLIAVLDAGSAQTANHIRQRKAAITIWAYYKGWRTRSQLKKFKQALPVLQQSFRKKREQRQNKDEEKRCARMQESEDQLERRRSFRKKREEQLHSLEIVPAGKVTNYIKSEESKAAVIIQAHWKAFRQRKVYRNKQATQQRCAAATVIQKEVRKFLKKKKMSRLSSIKDESMVDEDRRKHYLQEIERWQTVNKRVGVSRQEAEKIHKMAQEKLVLYFQRNFLAEREKQRTEGLLARIHTEQEILNHLPTLGEADTNFIEQLSCNSGVIQHAALLEHNKQMRYMTQPWWKQLNDGNDETLLDGW
ncbi:unnamed protein product [Clavelina lepadiformis]|uniref:IQ calmodulin-binding motif-containing protein 1 n=1 Tax=Clavelina lepadiformis TaxID=159417 RepID=A0ABP0F153_CLALP